jgi:hypothetical protein
VFRALAKRSDSQTETTAAFGLKGGASVNPAKAEMIDPFMMRYRLDQPSESLWIGTSHTGITMRERRAVICGRN